MTILKFEFNLFIIYVFILQMLNTLNNQSLKYFCFVSNLQTIIQGAPLNMSSLIFDNYLRPTFA